MTGFFWNEWVLDVARMPEADREAYLQRTSHPGAMGLRARLRAYFRCFSCGDAIAVKPDDCAANLQKRLCQRCLTETY